MARSVLFILSIFLVSMPTIAPAQSWGSIAKGAAQKAATDAARNGRMPTAGSMDAQDHQIRLYEERYKRGDMQAAFTLGQMYAKPPRLDYVQAATWYRNAYAGGLEGGGKAFIDLVTSGKVAPGNIWLIKPLVEKAAVGGSQLARNFLVKNYGETTLPRIRVDPYAWGMNPLYASEEEKAAQREAQAAALAEYNRAHPAPSAEEVARRNEESAEQGAAMLLGMLIVSNINRPSIGPGSILCDNYRLGVQGANDPRVCDSPTK